MKWNREVVTCLAALLVSVLGLWGVIQGLVTTQIRVPKVTLTRSSREVIPRQYRSFTEESEPGRNPFSFSEGWEEMEPSPMDLPPVPPAPRLLPLLGSGATVLEAGFLYEEIPLPGEKEKKP